MVEWPHTKKKKEIAEKEAWVPDVSVKSAVSRIGSSAPCHLHAPTRAVEPCLVPTTHTRSSNPVSVSSASTRAPTRGEARGFSGRWCGRVGSREGGRGPAAPADRPARRWCHGHGRGRCGGGGGPCGPEPGRGGPVPPLRRPLLPGRACRRRLHRPVALLVVTTKQVGGFQVLLNLRCGSGSDVQSRPFFSRS